jgi:hypothetical protein
LAQRVFLSTIIPLAGKEAFHKYLGGNLLCRIQGMGCGLTTPASSIPLSQVEFRAQSQNPEEMR